jgi:guanylate kinase
MTLSGRLIVLTGPSGVGKGTVVRLLRMRHPELFLSISATTRAPRAQEMEGVHYYFMTKADFQALIQGGELLEWAEYVGNYYGTLRQPVQEKLDAGIDVLVEIEVQGARQVLTNFPEAMTIFLLPPSLEILSDRLNQRQTETPETIERRLKRAFQEMAVVDEFRYHVVNDDLDGCLEQLESILYSPRKTPNGC